MGVSLLKIVMTVVLVDKTAVFLVSDSVPRLYSAFFSRGDSFISATEGASSRCIYCILVMDLIDSIGYGGL